MALDLVMQGATRQVHTKGRAATLGTHVTFGQKPSRSEGSSTDTTSNARTDELYEPTGFAKYFPGH